MAIGFVAVSSSAAASTASTITRTIAITDATDMVVAYASGLNATTGVTFDATGTPVAMTEAVAASAGAGAGAVSLYYILDANLPGAGTYTIEATFAAANNEAGLGAIALSGTKQGTPEA